MLHNLWLFPMRFTDGPWRTQKKSGGHRSHCAKQYPLVANADRSNVNALFARRHDIADAIAISPGLFIVICHKMCSRDWQVPQAAPHKWPNRMPVNKSSALGCERNGTTQTMIFSLLLWLCPVIYQEFQFIYSIFIS